MAISGDLAVSGPADPSQVRVAGVVNLDGGEVRFPLSLGFRI